MVSFFLFLNLLFLNKLQGFLLKSPFLCIMSELATLHSPASTHWGCVNSVWSKFDCLYFSTKLQRPHWEALVYVIKRTFVRILGIVAWVNSSVDRPAQHQDSTQNYWQHSDHCSNGSDFVIFELTKYCLFGKNSLSMIIIMLNLY